MEKIKLVIWDLDETFWGGTLSEGPITYLQKNHDMVVELTRRGIINSLASKNTFDEARAALAQHGIWDYFVFPKISWQPKGPMITAIIADMQLRAENVLFVDDNHLNIEEAKYYNPGLQTAGPEILHGLLSHDACAGKDDSSLSRLKQYKLLEKKTLDQKAALCSNDAFLRGSNICVEITQDCMPELERVLELINRTNQLNYTKHRVTQEELAALFANQQIDKGYIRVRDTYGDYGICGFYAAANGRLEHFLFSCRILNMGVESWLYHRLGCPEIAVEGEVASPLSKNAAAPEWIHESSPGGQAASGSEAAKKTSTISPIVKGGCDLMQIQNYLIKGRLFDAELDYVSDGGYRINNSHTEILKRCTQSTLKNYGAIVDKLHFFDRSAFRTKLFSHDYDVHIYSVLDDYTRGLYRYRATDFIIPFGDFTSDLTDLSKWEYHAGRSGKHYLTIEFLQWFKNNFTFLGPLDIDSFKQNMAWLSSNIRHDRLLIILNGSEVEYSRNPQGKRWERHKSMNQALHDTVKDLPHVVICDVRSFVRSPADHSHNLRHYTRQSYYHLAREINEIIKRRCHISSSLWEKQLNAFKYFFKISGKPERKLDQKKVHAQMLKL